MKFFLSALFILTPLSLAYAQAGGSADTPVSSDPQTKVDPETPTPPPADPSAVEPSSATGGGTPAQPQPTPTPGSSNVPPDNLSGSAVPTSAQSEPTPVSVGSATVTSEFDSNADANSSAPTNVIALVSAVAFALAAILGISFLIRSSRKGTPEVDGERCDSIRELLEQKKKELEEMARTYPEEKIKAWAKTAVLTEIKKDEPAKMVLDAVDAAQAAYTKLQQAISILQMRYDLCTLSLPSVSGAKYKGTIVENSLTDKQILEQIKVTKHYEAGDWKVKDVEVNEKQIEKLGATLDIGPWCMHFWQENEDDGIVVFRNASFKVKYSDTSTWKDAVAHGKALGIPEEQLDFVVKE